MDYQDMYLFFVATFLSIFATCVMSYISMATPIGPWIDPTIMLCGSLLFAIIRPHAYETSLALVTCAGSIGGILATAVAFSFPTLYFLDPSFFGNLIAHPFQFVAYLAGLSLTAGWFGIWIANILENKLITQEKLAFPIGNMVHGMIATHHNMRKAYELTIGFISSCIFGIVQDVGHFIPKTVALLSATSWRYFSIPVIPFDISPLLWAIGFVTGHVIALPLAVGAFSRIAIAAPINNLLFNHLSNTEFNFAFCSGIVLYSTLIGMFLTAQKTYASWRVEQWASTSTQLADMWHHLSATFWWSLSELICLVLLTCIFLSYLGFSIACQVYLLFLTFIFTRQITFIAGRIGLAPLGAFATFVMFPALFIFDLTALQIVFIAAFVEICGGVAADTLFGRKVGHLGNISHARLKYYQYLGLIVASIAVGIIFWLLIQKFGVGSLELGAYKAQSRALLVQAVKQVNYFAIIPGFIFAFIVQSLGVNASLVLGGLLMPLSISIGLITGGILTLLTKRKEEWYPLWSGIFAAQSVWMLVRALI